MGVALSKNNQGDGTYVIINRDKVVLPNDAKFVMQDKRGIWYYTSRHPRIKNNDWTPNKLPIQVKNNKGYVRPLMTDADSNWANTVQATIQSQAMRLTQ